MINDQNETPDKKILKLLAGGAKLTRKQIQEKLNLTGTPAKKILVD